MLRSCGFRPFTRRRSEAERWLARAGDALDGVIAKRLDGAYQPGERAMLKVKRMRSADCVVGGFRYARTPARSGRCCSGSTTTRGGSITSGSRRRSRDVERPALTRRLEAMVEPPGFTGKAPGGPSRWSTERSGEWQPLRPELVVEVRYDHVTGDRFRHGTKLLRWRPDKAPRQCTFEQMTCEVRPARLIAGMLGRR